MKNILFRILFPTFCFVCNQKGPAVCASCTHGFLAVNYVQRCHVCSREVRLGFTHIECLESTSLDGLLFVSVYNQLAKDLIHKGKYSGQFSIFNDLGHVMSQFLQSYYRFPREQTVLTWAPMFKRKKNIRGFDQAEILCKSLGKHADFEVQTLLKRTKSTKTQVGMQKAERTANVKNAFSYCGTENVTRELVILVDDVFTTGSTMEECAKLLKQHGAKKVIGFTFAKSRIEDS